MIKSSCLYKMNKNVDKNDKFTDSLVFDYLDRMEKNSSILFKVNRSPVRINILDKAINNTVHVLTGQTM